MMRMNFIASLAFAGCLQAQGPPAAQTAPPVGSISGVVKEATSGAPVAEATISLSTGGIVRADLYSRLRATTDSQGVYSIHDVPPGRYSFVASADKVRPARRTVTVNSGQDVAAVDFRVMRPGSISGKAIDENKEPLEGVSLLLVAKEYFLGVAHDYMKGLTSTNDRGEYSFGFVEPGRAWAIVAEKRVEAWDAKSDVPLNPKLRRPALAPTYYPSSRSVEGAVAFTLRPGEAQEGVDIKMTRTPSLCLEAVTLAAGAPASLNFQLDEQNPFIGMFSGGGYFLNAVKGLSGKDGRIRLCDLHPGQYRLTAQADPDRTTAPPVFGITPVTVGDQDVRDLRAMAMPGFAIAGEVAWEGPAPEKPVNLQVDLSMMPLTRGRWVGEAQPPKVSVPGQFTFERVLGDTYRFTATVNSPGVYVKDIVAGGLSILNQPLEAASVGSGGIRIVVARDGGSLSARVADKDGNPVAEATVYVMPASVASEGALSALLVSGTTDQAGEFRTEAPLPPGKYLVLASETPASPVVERIAKLWQSRSRATEAEIGPAGSAQVRLELVNLEGHR